MALFGIAKKGTSHITLNLSEDTSKTLDVKLYPLKQAAYQPKLGDVLRAAGLRS